MASMCYVFYAMCSFQLILSALFVLKHFLSFCLNESLFNLGSSGSQTSWFHVVNQIQRLPCYVIGFLFFVFPSARSTCISLYFHCPCIMLSNLSQVLKMKMHYIIYTFTKRRWTCTMKIFLGPFIWWQLTVDWLQPSLISVICWW